MKRTIYRCLRPHHSGQEIWDDKVEEDNKQDYTEEVEWVKCPECRKLPVTPEEKLLDAIFGVKEPK